MRNYLFSIILGLLISCHAKETNMQVKIKRFVDKPIIPPFLEEEIGSNINGPSLIRAPDWIKDRLGKYYLYFADHKGDRIKMAYSDSLSGPWKIHIGGTLHLKESYFLTNEPDIPEDFDISELKPRDAHPEQIDHIPQKITDLTYPHIASPDVHIDKTKQEIIMYYHGLDEFGLQKTRVAVSTNGLDFIARKKIVGWPYFKKFSYQGENYGISMPGIIYRNFGDIDDFSIVNQVMGENTRHSAVMVSGDKLIIFFSRKGDKPERILLTTIDLRLDPEMWSTSEPIEILRPEKEWEGSTLPLYKSVESAINIPANQLRDPAVYSENGRNYLLYSLRGENGIGIVEFLTSEP